MPNIYTHFWQAIDRKPEKTQGDSGRVSKIKPDRLDSITKHFLDERDDIASINDFTAKTKESSVEMAFKTMCLFQKSSRIGGRLQKLTNIAVNFPLAIWQQRQHSIRRWWHGTLEIVKPEQGYIGLVLALPPIIERIPFIEPAEYALTKAFYGLDVDKPMFMAATPNAEGKAFLEHGMRTPAFGAFVGPKYLAQCGGEAAVRTAVADDARIVVEPVAHGLWLQAGEAPQLHPVERGIPHELAVLARALKPARLDALNMLSFFPPVPRPDTFDHERGRQWLRRFDDDGTWPEPALRHFQPAGPAANAPADPAQTGGSKRCEGGQPCPRDGIWSTLASPDSIRRFKKGEVMPSFPNSRLAASIWNWDGE